MVNSERWNCLLHCTLIFNPFTLKGLFYHNSTDWSISNSTVLIFKEILVFNPNCVHPDQMPQNVAFDLGLHCLLISLVGVS